MPTAVSGGRKFASIVAAGRRACGLLATGLAYCWGDNYQGQLGDGTSANARSVPVAVVGNVTFRQLSLGRYARSCGLSTDSVAYCWGENYTSTPTVVAGKYAYLASGDGHTCVLTAGGAAQCWGNNQFGQLGDSTQTDRASPVAVSGNKVFTTLAAGAAAHSCGLDVMGKAFCWGYNNAGQLGDGTTANRVTPKAVSTTLAFVTIAGGASHTCASTVDGKVYCWGRNQYGQLGDSTYADRYTPVQVKTTENVRRLTLGDRHTCAVNEAKIAHCWGSNQYGQLGDGMPLDHITPMPVRALPGS